jgi:hypothetical protein
MKNYYYYALKIKEALELSLAWYSMLYFPA